MRKYYLGPLVCFAALISGPAHSDTAEKQEEVGSWLIGLSKVSPGCTALRAGPDGQALFVEYYAKTGSVYLGAANKNATSMEEGTKVNLKVEFVRGKHWDDGWGETEFVTIVGSEGIRFFRSASFTKEMLDDLAHQDFVVIMNGDKMVAGAKLDGSAAMVTKLRECSDRAAGLNPKDPFVP